MHGRTDLNTGSEEDMQESINKILKMPDNVIIYPGHGAISIVKEEKEHYAVLNSLIDKQNWQ